MKKSRSQKPENRIQNSESRIQNIRRKPHSQILFSFILTPDFWILTSVFIHPLLFFCVMRYKDGAFVERFLAPGADYGDA